GNAMGWLKGQGDMLWLGTDADGLQRGTEAGAAGGEHGDHTGFNPQGGPTVRVRLDGWYAVNRPRVLRSIDNGGVRHRPTIGTGDRPLDPSTRSESQDRRLVSEGR